MSLLAQITQSWSSLFREGGVFILSWLWVCYSCFLMFATPGCSPSILNQTDVLGLSPSPEGQRCANNLSLKPRVLLFTESGWVVYGGDGLG